jgi:hypothetical protein
MSVLRGLVPRLSLRRFSGLVHVVTAQSPTRDACWGTPCVTWKWLTDDDAEPVARGAPTCVRCAAASYEKT